MLHPIDEVTSNTKDKEFRLWHFRIQLLPDGPSQIKSSEVDIKILCMQFSEIQQRSRFCSVPKIIFRILNS